MDILYVRSVHKNVFIAISSHLSLSLVTGEQTTSDIKKQHLNEIKFDVFDKFFNIELVYKICCVTTLLCLLSI